MMETGELKKIHIKRSSGSEVETEDILSAGYFTLDIFI